MRSQRTNSAAPVQDAQLISPADSAYLFTSEVAELLQVSPKTIARWAKEGKLPFRRTLGGHRRFRVSEIRRCLEEMSREEA